MFINLGTVDVIALSHTSTTRVFKVTELKWWFNRITHGTFFYLSKHGRPGWLYLRYERRSHTSSERDSLSEINIMKPNRSSLYCILRRRHDGRLSVAYLFGEMSLQWPSMNRLRSNFSYSTLIACITEHHPSVKMWWPPWVCTTLVCPFRKNS